MSVGRWDCGRLGAGRGLPPQSPCCAFCSIHAEHAELLSHGHLFLISHPLSTIPFLTSTSIISLNLLFSGSLIRSILLDPRVHSSVLILLYDSSCIQSNPTQADNSVLLPGTLSPLGFLSITLSQLLSVALVLSPIPLLSS